MSRYLNLAIALAISAPIAAQAQSAPVDGTYVMEGGSYTIQVRQVGDTLEVEEPNRTSIYTRQPDGSYHTWSEKLQQTYAMRIVDDRTLEAFRPNAGTGKSTRLIRSGPVPVRTVPVPPSAVADGAREGGWAPDGPTAGNADSAIADKYLALARSDPKETQAWAFCSAAALKRSTATGAEADAYGRTIATALKSIAVDPATSPCPDAIPQALWDGAETPAPGETAPAPATPAPAPEPDISAEEEATLKRLNEEANIREQQAAAARDAALRQQAERDAAYRASQDQYDRDRAAYEASVAAANAADAEYRRKMEEYERVNGTAPPR
jgi:hypothetical protein